MKHFLNKRHLATTVVFIIFLINVILPSAAGASPSTPLRIPTPTPQVEKTSRLLELRRELEQVPNFLQYTEYKMLKYKSEIGARATTEKSKTSADDYLIQPRGLSPLSLELTGGFNTDSFLSFNSLAGTSISTLTGMAAIDESLQLGSINAEREDTAAREERQRIDYALNKYYYDNNYVYPQSLDQLIPKYLPNIPKNFTYIKKGSSFELRFTPPPSTAMPISAVQPLTIKSHPWETMTESKPRIPEIFSLVPNDYSLAYFSSAEKFDEFETAIQKMAKPLSRIYGVGNAISYREKIFQRLGISHIPRLSDVFDEAAFISHDIDIFPNTEYALIFKVKSEISDFPSKFLTAPSGTHGKAGDYYIVASHPDLFDEISRISGTSKSLANAKDLAYILSVMEKEYDGFVYLSEAFIQKLTSPAYRINSKRRNIIAKALVDLQYVSIAYRDITGKWPLSFQQLVDEQYIAPKTIASIENYSIDENGIVSHKDWGTVYNITPVRQVPIKEVFPGERSSYDEFREQYEQYWQEFIDPVGIAILVGDHIRFHTVILPLINESRYNWLKSLAGGESAEFQFIKNPDRIPSFQIISKFNTDDILYALYKTAPQEFDENYKKCAKDYYEIRPYPRDPVSKFCTIAEKPRTEAIVLVKDMLAKQLEWNEPEELFDFIGNEATIAVGDAMEYKISDFAKFDAYFGLAIDDTEGAKKFLEHVFRWYNKEMGGNSRNDYDMGFFSFSATEPLKNSYND
ncbi:MAG: hypothetical protein HYV77_00880, partial [Candidatus Wildermuthbacteria bacterium]|nr:hypothetical protein [Candidatus Wildermuthbacteria bacterium]